MKVLFINPNFSSGRSKDAMEPLVYAFLSALTPLEIERKLYDERIESIDFNEPADLIAISVQTFTSKRAYKIADIYRKKKIQVVMGGFHPSLMPDEAKEHCDSVVIGDAESVWHTVLRDAEKKELAPFYTGSRVIPLTGLIPDRQIFEKKPYSILKPVQFSRGCRYACDFCSVHSFYGSSIRTRPVQELVEEISHIRSQFIFFVDDNFLSNYTQTKELLAGIIPLKKKWISQVSIDAAFDQQLLLLMQQSGCVSVFIGFESLNTRSLSQMHKGENLKRDYKSAILQFRKHGIMVSGAFVFGYDEDTESNIKAAVDFAIEQKFCLAHFNILFPTPGTPLYERLLKEGRLIYGKWWLSDDFRYGDCYFQPHLMSSNNLADAVFAARRKFNRLSTIALRSLDFRCNARGVIRFFLFWISNLINRKEIFRKQGVPLG